MTLQQLTNRLRAEARQQKGKAIVLGAISLLAIFMWGRLLWNSESDETPPLPPNLASTAAPPSGAVTAAASPSPAYEAQRPQGGSQISKSLWTQWRDERKTNPFYEPGQLAADTRSPFASAAASAPSQPERGPGSGDEAEDPPEAPQQLGFKLQATIVEPGRSTARINGATYRVSDQLKLNGQQTGYRLEEVKSDGVVLSFKGQRFQLELEQSKPQGTIQIRRRGQAG